MKEGDHAIVWTVYSFFAFNGCGEPARLAPTHQLLAKPETSGGHAVGSFRRD